MIVYLAGLTSIGALAPVWRNEEPVIKKILGGGL